MKLILLMTFLDSALISSWRTVIHSRTGLQATQDLALISSWQTVIHSRTGLQATQDLALILALGGLSFTAGRTTGHADSQ